jgi:hypothetical protein
MGERPDQIERHIRSQRDELGDNFSELEQKVKSAFDWRSQFSERPGTMLGLAFAGGVVLAAILPSTSSITSRVTSRRRSFSDGYSPYSNRSTAETQERANSYQAPSGSSKPPSETWDNLRNAAIGLATSRLTEYLETLAPGFSEQYRKVSSKPGTPYSAPSRPAETSVQRPNGGTDYASHS